MFEGLLVHVSEGRLRIWVKTADRPGRQKRREHLSLHHHADVRLATADLRCVGTYGSTHWFAGLVR